jgi:hypothetical protein
MTRKILTIIEEKERDKKAVAKLRIYGRLLLKKHNRKKRQKALRELKEIAKELLDPIYE